MGNLIDSAINVAAIQAELKQVEELLSNFIQQSKDAAASLQNIYDNSGNIKSINELTNAQNLYNKAVEASEKAESAKKQALTETEKLQKKLENATSAEAVAVEQLKLKINEANKFRKEQAKALNDAEKAEENYVNGLKDSGDSLNDLKKFINQATKEYYEMSKAQRESAEGKEFIGSIKSAQEELKEANYAVSNFRDNVGNYPDAMAGAIGANNGFAGSLLNIIQTSGGVTKAIGMIGQSLKALALNPIVAVMGAIVLVFNQVKQAINESEERTVAAREAFAKLQPIVKVVGDLFEGVADILTKFVSTIGNAAGAILNFLNITDKEVDSAEKFANAEKLKQEAILETRNANVENAKNERDISELRAKTADKENYTAAERLKFSDEAAKIEAKNLENNLKAAQKRMEALEAEAALDDNNAEMNEKLAQSRSDLYNVERAYNEGMRSLTRERQRLLKEEEAAEKERIKEAQEYQKKRLDLQRRYEDLQIENQEESVEKQRKIIEINYKREIEDLEVYGKERIKFIEEIEKKYQIKRDELAAENLKKNNENMLKELELIIINNENRLKLEANTIEEYNLLTDQNLSVRKAILQKQYEIEIKEAEKLGINKLLIAEKYRLAELQLMEDDNDKKAEILIKQSENQIKIFERGLDQQVIDLKKKYAAGLMSKEEFDEEMIRLNENLIVSSIQNQIELSEELLKNEEITGQKRLEIEEKITNLRGDLARAITDFLISEDERRMEDWKKKVQRYSDVAIEALAMVNDAMSVSFENQLQRIDEKFSQSQTLLEQEQERLDKTEMAEEEREARQAILDKKKQDLEKKSEREQQEIRMKQARWEKANALIQATIATAVAIAKVAANPIAAIAAGVVGAAQIAIIAAQQIPKYFKGGVTGGEPLSMIAEVRPEVAVTPSGKVQLFETPTITHFEKGTEIFESVPKFLQSLNYDDSNSLTFDYDKFAKAIKEGKSDVYVNLSAKNTWSVEEVSIMRKIFINRSLRTKL